jgi:hypothetical protein
MRAFAFAGSVLIYIGALVMLFSSVRFVSIAFAVLLLLLSDLQHGKSDFLWIDHWSYPIALALLLLATGFLVLLQDNRRAVLSLMLKIDAMVIGVSLVINAVSIFAVR